MPEEPHSPFQQAWVSRFVRIMYYLHHCCHDQRYRRSFVSVCALLKAIMTMVSTAATLLSRVTIATPTASRRVPVSFVAARSGAGFRGPPRSVPTQQHQETTCSRLLHEQQSPPNTGCYRRRGATTTAGQVAGAHYCPARLCGNVQRKRRRRGDARLSVSRLERDGREEEAVGRDHGEGTWLLGAPAIISVNGVAKRFDQQR